MQGEVTVEALRKQEPAITVYSVEDDALFHERMGKDEDFEEDGMNTTKMVSQRVHTETLEALEKKERILAETLETLGKKEAVIEKRDAVIKELQARAKLFEDTQEDEGEDKK